MGHSAVATFVVAVYQQASRGGEPGPGTTAATWHQDAAVLVIGLAAALFVVAGVIRMARWRVAGDPHSALVGSALVVMGGLYLPLAGIAAVGGALQHRELAAAAIRALVSLITIALVVRALYASTVRRFDRPSRLLPVLVTVVLLAFGGLVAVEGGMTNPVPSGPRLARLVSAVMVVGWLAAAAAIRTRNLGLPWSRRAVPLFGGLAAAEACYGLSGASTSGTAAALAVCTLVAVLSVWSAHLDLAAALLHSERAFGSLSHMLADVRREAVELSEWRANLVHDADNAVAGLRAALEVLGDRDDHLDGPEARLCRAASDEVRHLDHLLHRSPHTPCGPFEVAELVRSVGQSAQVLGAPVTIRADSAVATGRPDDVVAVLKNLLSNADRHAPGAAVELVVELTPGLVRIVCADAGPGMDPDVAGRAFQRGVRGPSSDGSGLGLHEARALMRAQGGDLVLEPQATGARFVATLPVVIETRARVPAQRSAPSITHACVPVGQTL
jgi:signal transduction histidine kinase